MSSPPGATVPSMAGTPSQLAISNGVLLAAVIFLFMVVVFVFLLYLYAKRFLGANPMLNGASTPSSRFIFVGDSPFPGRGLPASVLRSLPVAVYAASPTTPGKKADALECAVCLSEVADGEKVRALPKCDHRFHVECIDMWFHSHDTCPLCRAPVGADNAAAEESGLPRVPREDPATVDFPMFPTNVLFWGTHDDDFTTTNLGMPRPAPAPIAPATSSSSSASGLRKENLVIDIPNRPMMVVGASSPLPASRMPGSASDDLRSPMSARLRSLRRLLSRGKQAVAGTSSSSPRGGGDIEQGLAGRPPKTPKTPPSSN